MSLRHVTHGTLYTGRNYVGSHVCNFFVICPFPFCNFPHAYLLQKEKLVVLFASTYSYWTIGVEQCLAIALRSTMASSPAAGLFFTFLLFCICQQRVVAWSPSASSSVYLHSSQRASTSKLHVNSSIEEHQQLLSSAYDRNLPAALVGEAVRSALRSDRGICFDFTTDRYAKHEHDKCNKHNCHHNRLVFQVYLSLNKT